MVMKKIELSSVFKSKLKKWSRKHPEKVHLLIDKLLLFHIDIQHPSLKTHKLTGSLNGLYAFSVELDCRIVFINDDTEKVILVDIGTHDEVY